MNQTLSQIYDEYREELQRALEYEERAPHTFSRKQQVEQFEKHLEHLDTLIALYWDLLIVIENSYLR